MYNEVNDCDVTEVSVTVKCLCPTRNRRIEDTYDLVLALESIVSGVYTHDNVMPLVNTQAYGAFRQDNTMQM